jgi:hypothetical protein
MIADQTIRTAAADLIGALGVGGELPHFELLDHAGNNERLIDQSGPPAWISPVLPPPGTRMPFDDLAVQSAGHAQQRDALRGAQQLDRGESGGEARAL